ncbi:sensor histidine kinase [Cohnella sp. WQ 127256]|uniref:sensor histidine kinase n=1 Tax=Cohnella sp. WQ 127256 TaxID=2938790 RepID=UPI002117CB67|nr:sensor histidine kinase [Cohnella sp. WQ 127256]
MRNIRTLFFRHLSVKLIMTILLLLVFSISLTSSFYYWSSSAIIAKNVRISTKQSAKQSADYLSLILRVGNDIGQQIFLDAKIQEAIQAELRGNLGVKQKFAMNETVNQILNNIMYTSSFIRSIYLLKEEGSSWGSGLLNFSKVKRYTLNEHKWYMDVVNDRVGNYWQALHYDPFSGGGENTELVLTLVKPLRNLETRETLGVIMINMNGNLLLEAIQRIKLGKTGTFFVINPEGNIMMDSESDNWDRPIADSMRNRLLSASGSEEQEFETDIAGVRSYVIARKIDNEWIIVGTVPLQEVVSDIQQIQNKIWLYSTLFLIVAILIGWLFSSRITSPLKHLMRQMSQIEKSNFKARTHVRSQDEIGQLSHRFNKMAGEIETLIERVNIEESQKREAEIRALRHQINPHFLYNTLSSIRWMVKFGKSEEAYEGISSLVKLMEASMEKKGVFSTIGDELSLLDKYITIQQFRYGSHIRLFVHCDEGLLEMKIPRMLMQPIVENAIFHGISPKENGGEIHLRIQLKEYPLHTLEISIEDDGLGIPPDKINSLLQSSPDPKSGMFGIGLNHVHEMIQLYYGLQSGVTLESEWGAGTKVRMKLVMKEPMQR